MASNMEDSVLVPLIPETDLSSDTTDAVMVSIASCTSLSPSDEIPNENNAMENDSTNLSVPSLKPITARTPTQSTQESPFEEVLDKTPMKEKRAETPIKTQKMSLKDRLQKAQSLVEDRRSAQELLPNPDPIENAVDLKRLKRIRTIGVGLFGKVDEVTHGKRRQPFALKVISKGIIKERDTIENLLQEKETLRRLNSDFIIKLYSTMQNDQYCFFLLELVNGGEFYQLLRFYTSFTESYAKFYAASVALALNHMHENDIVYRDLKPENLMLDDSGYVKVIDLGFAKIIGTEKAYTFCGTPEYLAPEMANETGHSYALDWWTLGILIFEMIIGITPFRSKDLEGCRKKICSGRFTIPANRMSKQAERCIREFLVQDPASRLGIKDEGFIGIRVHPWFYDLDWVELELQEMDAPIVPSEVPPESCEQEIPFVSINDNDGLFDDF